MNNSSSKTTTTTKNATPSTPTSAGTATTASKQTKISKLISVGGRRKLVTGNSTPLHLKKELLDVSSPVIIRSFNANAPTCTGRSATNKSLPTKRSLNPILLAAKNREPPKQPSSNLQEILVYEDDNNPFLDDGNNASFLTEILPSQKPQEKEQEKEHAHKEKEKQHKQQMAKKIVIPEPSKDVRLLKSSANDKVPAFERFANLTGTTQMGLKLPKRFFHLENLLSLMDRLISLKSGRSEPFIFAKSIRSLESALGKRCEWNQLRMLFSLYKDGCGEALYKIDRMAIIDNGKKIVTASLSIPPPPTTFKGSEHDYLAHRRSVVLSSLTKVMTKRHEIFLSSINFSLPSGAQLKAWHPKFDYESSNPSDDDISLFEILPSDSAVDVASASFKVESLISGSSSSRETLNAINSIIPNKEIESKLTNEKGASVTLQNSLQPEQTPLLPPKMAAGANSVLERIRKKQRDAELLRMGALESGETKEFLAQKHKLQNMIPLLDKITMIFASSKKGALLLTDVKTRLMDSSNGLLSALEIIEQIDALVKVIRPSGYLKSINAGSSGSDGGFSGAGAESGPLTLRLTKEVPLQKAKDCIVKALENLYKNK